MIKFHNSASQRLGSSSCPKNRNRRDRRSAVCCANKNLRQYPTFAKRCFQCRWGTHGVNVGLLLVISFRRPFSSAFPSRFFGFADPSTSSRPYSTSSCRFLQLRSRASQFLFDRYSYSLPTSFACVLSVPCLSLVFCALSFEIPRRIQTGSGVYVVMKQTSVLHIDDPQGPVSLMSTLG